MRLTVVFKLLLAGTCFVMAGQSFGQTIDLNRPQFYESFKRPVAKLDVKFTPQMQDALDSGVPLSIELDFVYITPRLFYDNHSVPEQHYFRIARHALANRYMVRHNEETRPRLFATMSGLTDYIGVETIRLFESYTIEYQGTSPSTESTPHLKLALNKYELPGPVRISAFLTRQWDFNTGWITWDFEN